MTEDITDAEIEVWLEQANPFIEQDARLLGTWPQPTFRCPEDLHDRVRWRTRHGPATIAWLFGNPQRIWSAVCADSTRCDLTWTVDGGFRRAVPGAVRWRYGRIDVRTDDVRFIEGEQPHYNAPSSTAGAAFVKDLAHDQFFIAALQDERFAHATYDVIADRSFTRIGSTGPWTGLSHYDTARLVAALRGAGESVEDFIVDEDDFHDWPGSRHAGYKFKGVWPDDRAWREADLDEKIRKERSRFRKPFFWSKDDTTSLARYEQELAELRSDPNGDVMRLLHAHLSRLGWRTATRSDREEAEERALDQRVAILHEIRTLEARRAQSQLDATASGRPTEDGRIHGPIMIVKTDLLAKLSPDRREAYFPASLLDRIRSLTSSGRISDHERHDLEARLQEASQRYFFGTP